MRTTRLIAILAGIATIAAVVADADAMYHPTVGRFLQRDPGPGRGGPIRIGATGPTGGGRFARRDLAGQYADGMNLYQYARSSPTARVDPLGTLSVPQHPVGVTDGNGYATWDLDRMNCCGGRRYSMRTECCLAGSNSYDNHIDGKVLKQTGIIGRDWKGFCCKKQGYTISLVRRGRYVTDGPVDYLHMAVCVTNFRGYRNCYAFGLKPGAPPVWSQWWDSGVMYRDFETELCSGEDVGSFYVGEGVGKSIWSVLDAAVGTASPYHVLWENCRDWAWEVYGQLKAAHGSSDPMVGMASCDAAKHPEMR